MEMITLKEINKKYKNKYVLNNVNLEINFNESLGIVGANGSGKSTLIDVVTSSIKPDSGNVIKKEKIFFGVQYQETVWPYGTKIKDIIQIFKSKKDMNEKEFLDIFNYFEIEGILNERIDNLSGGQKQRFNCFLALSNQANLLIFDELITGLDLKIQDKLIEYLKKYKEKSSTSFIIISHVPEEIEYLTDKFLIIDEGKIIGLFETKKITQKHGTIRNFLEAYFLKGILLDE